MTYNNFYKKDIRTPSTYFENKEATDEAMEKLKSKLDDLLLTLYALKEKGKGTPAAKKIVDVEIDKAEIQRYKKCQRKTP